MKYAIAILGILAMLLGAAPAGAKEVLINSIPVKAVASSIEGVNLGTVATPKITKPKKTNIKKPKTKKPATKKPVVKKSTTKKTVPKKATQKPKKPVKPKKTAPKKTTKNSKAITDNAEQVEKADLNGVDQKPQATDSTDNQTLGAVKLPEVSSSQKRGSNSAATKATAVASVAGVSGIGLLLLLKKIFWH